MARKDWVKVDKITWENVKREERIQVFKNLDTGRYDAKLYSSTGSVKYLINYTTKAQAMTSAENYMRTH